MRCLEDHKMYLSPLIISKAHLFKFCQCLCFPSDEHLHTGTDKAVVTQQDKHGNKCDISCPDELVRSIQMTSDCRALQWTVRIEFCVVQTSACFTIFRNLLK